MALGLLGRSCPLSASAGCWYGHVACGLFMPTSSTGRKGSSVLQCNSVTDYRVTGRFPGPHTLKEQSQKNLHAGFVLAREVMSSRAT